MGCKGSRVRIPPRRPVESSTWPSLRIGPFSFLSIRGTIRGTTGTCWNSVYFDSIDEALAVQGSDLFLPLSYQADGSRKAGLQPYRASYCSTAAVMNHFVSKWGLLALSAGNSTCAGVRRVPGFNAKLGSFQLCGIGDGWAILDSTKNYCKT